MLLGSVGTSFLYTVGLYFSSLKESLSISVDGLDGPLNKDEKDKNTLIILHRDSSMRPPSGTLS